MWVLNSKSPAGIDLFKVSKGNPPKQFVEFVQSYQLRHQNNVIGESFVVQIQLPFCFLPILFPEE